MMSRKINKEFNKLDFILKQENKYYILLYILKNTSLEYNYCCLHSNIYCDF